MYMYICMYKCAYVIHVYSYTVCIISYQLFINFVYFYVVISSMNHHVSC